eukprot:scaffold21592_cov125-Isochrysis_galbana.AAC.2
MRGACALRCAGLALWPIDFVDDLCTMSPLGVGKMVHTAHTRPASERGWAPGGSWRHVACGLRIT